MRKKDYELIASCINDAIGGNTVYPDGDIMAIVQNLANALGTINPKFDRQKFLTACGIEQHWTVESYNRTDKAIKDSLQIK